MTDVEKREAARMIYYKWNGRGKEDEDDRSFWIDIMQDLLGIEHVTDKIEFQKKVVGSDGNTKRIDAYIPEAKVLIEQKSLQIDLSKPQTGHNGMTPYEQAKYYDNCLPYADKARWIIVSNFKEFWIYDMNLKKAEPVIIELANLQTQYTILEDIILKKKKKEITKEIELSLKAGELVGKIHERFQSQYNDPFAPHTQKSLNILCTRIVFCLYAEDAGLFGEKDSFTSYIEKTSADNVRSALIELFKVLDTPLGSRAEMYLSEELEKFPYVNGGLFKDENIVIPRITEEIKQTLIESAKFDWSEISPTIFGAVFESTLNAETRRSGGMHYTSIENIHKVIDPLFLDKLNEEFKDICAISVKKTREGKLTEFQNRLAGFKFFDPACGSGNFLTETYICLRRLENKVLKELNQGQIVLELMNPIKVQISQFYGIEINDFAVTVAKTALWIAESQMMKETEDVVHMSLDFLPLKTNANIHEGNSLNLSWENIISNKELSYIMGNPPFIGARLMSDAQKSDVARVFGDKWKNTGNLDYVSCWYKKCADYIMGTTIKAALVSTSSVVQGETVATLWEPLFKMGLGINFAYTSFIWDSEANSKAHVHCVIIGFSMIHIEPDKRIFTDSGIIHAVNINAYLLNAENVFIQSRKTPICQVSGIVFGSMANDSGQFILTEEEKEEILIKEPELQSVIRPFLGAEEFINNKKRFCIWLKDVSPSVIKGSQFLMEKVTAVKEARLSSKREATKKLADTPTLFGEIRQPEEGMYLLIPRVSSEKRRYVPMGFLSHEVIASDAVQLVPNATLYEFGILTSNVHMAWMRAVCGRLESRYRYSASVVYNNFPWPAATEEQKEKIMQTAQDILTVRELYSDSSLADLYDTLTMPPELLKAHQKNDVAVMRAYGLDIKDTTESDCVAFLMSKYKELVQDKK